MRLARFVPREEPSTDRLVPVEGANLPGAACIPTTSADGRAREATDRETSLMPSSARANQNTAPGRSARPRDLTACGPKAEPLSDATVALLVEKARDGDRESFGVLYQEYRSRIFNLARFSLPHAAAEDAVGETFVRAWAGLPRYRDMGVPFVAWLYGIARHVVTDAQRVGMRVEPRAEPRLDEPDHRDGELDRLTLGAALAQLPEDQRAVIELKFLAGLSNEEVGATLGKTAGAVNTQQWRALAALRSFLEEA